MISMKKINDQKGIVSILVSIVMMIVLTLLVLGLAQIGVSDQKNALKRQLSTEAYYLAESGINNSINNNFSGNCSGGITIDSSNGASIPCVKASQVGSLTSSLYQLNNGQSKVVPVSGTSNINSINFKWTGSGNTGTCTNSNHALTTVSSWTCPYPLLMVNLVSANLLSSGSLVSSLFNEGTTNGIVSFYIYPLNTGLGSATITGTNQIVEGKCDSGNYCSMTVDTSSISAKELYLRITPIYGSTALTLSSYKTIDGSGAPYNTRQASVDSTGKVGDTSQRLYTRITKDTTVSNLPNQGLLDQTPLFGIQTTQDLCKNFQGYYNNSSDYYINTASQTGPGGSNQAC